MRAISNSAKPEKEDPWIWDSLTDKQARQLEATQNAIRANFFTTAERHIIKLIIHTGGLKKSMETLGFGPLFLLPEFIRKEQGPALFQTFVDKLLK